MHCIQLSVDYYCNLAVLNYTTANKRKNIQKAADNSFQEKIKRKAIIGCVMGGF
jgi:hypothetical protein